MRVAGGALRERHRRRVGGAKAVIGDREDRRVDVRLVRVEDFHDVTVRQRVEQPEYVHAGRQHLHVHTRNLHGLIEGHRRLFVRVRRRGAHIVVASARRRVCSVEHIARVRNRTYTSRGDAYCCPIDMRFIHLFLVGYFVVVMGVALGLWQTGVLTRVAPVWLGVGILVAVGVGIMMSVAAGKPTASEKLQP